MSKATLLASAQDNVAQSASPQQSLPQLAQNLMQRLSDLDARFATQAEQTLALWADDLRRAGYRPSAENLAYYLALRGDDLRELQNELLRFGVSSLGRCEPYARPNVQAVGAALSALAGQPPAEVGEWYGQFGVLKARLAANSQALLGEQIPGIMVTFPSEAAEDAQLVADLLEAGMTVARINLAHDSEAEWAKMLANLRAACEAQGRSCRVYMDLAGPKVRTGKVHHPKGHEGRLQLGDELWLGPTGEEGKSGQFWVTCTLPAALNDVAVGHSVWFDDGKMSARVEEREAGNWLRLRVTHAKEKGQKLRPEKGINFPDTTLNLPALTDKDRADLPFAVRHADMLGYSFVQTREDVAQLLVALEAAQASAELGIVLKVETQAAVQHLPELIVMAAGSRPCGVMIARGDLAVELGFAQMMELQEELLWICEAAHVPVIWATQVLETLVKKGTPTRGEYTDAAGGIRADCVMLNKGAYILEAVREIAELRGRMRQHLHRKRPQLAPLDLGHHR